MQWNIAHYIAYAMRFSCKVKMDLYGQIESVDKKILSHLFKAFDFDSKPGNDAELNADELRFAKTLSSLIQSYSRGGNEIEHDHAYELDSSDEDAPGFGCDFSDCEIGSVSSSCFGDQTDDEDIFQDNQEWKRDAEALDDSTESERTRRKLKRESVDTADDEELDPSYEPEPELKQTSCRIFERFRKDQIDRIYDYYSTKAKKKKVSTTCKKFQSLGLTANELNAIKRYKTEGNDFEKYLQIDNLAFESFKEDRANGVIVRRPHLVAYLRGASKEINPKKSCLSSGYIDRFCKSHRIGYKKITRVVNKTAVVDESKDFEIANQFVEETRRYIEENGKKFFNLLKLFNCGESKLIFNF